MGSWEKLGRTVGLLVLVATLTACSSGGGPLLAPPVGAPGVGPPASDPSLLGPPHFGPSALGSAGGDWAGPSRSTFRAETGTPSEAAGEPADTAADDRADSVSSGAAGGAAGASPAGATATAGGTQPATRPEIVVHVVAAGESVSGIAALYGVQPSTVAASAGLANPNRIYPGQKLVFPSVDGVLHRVRPGETLSGIGRTYQVSPDIIAKANGITNPAALQADQILIVPGGRPPRATVASVPSGSTPAAGGGTLAWPLRGPITSPFGPRWGRTHKGIDIGAQYGAIIRAAAAGKVSFVGWYGLYGRCVIIDHGGGLTTLYGHASTILVSTGHRVAQGDAIAKVGTSGNSTGPHLHFEVRSAGKAQDPLLYLGE